MKAELPWQPVSLKSNIWDVCKKHISRHDLLTICVKFRHIKAKCSSWFWCHITLAFFQLEMHGGIFHSCCSFTVIYDKREKLCHTISFGQCKHRHLDFFNVAWKHWKPGCFQHCRETVPFCSGNAWQEPGEKEVLEESSCWSWNIQSKDVESLQTEWAE